MSSNREVILLKGSLVSDFQRIQELQSRGDVQVIDQLRSQVLELLLCRNPLLNKTQVIQNELIDAHLEAQNPHYGVWAYYPWNNQLIHILPEKDFIEVRTNRNKNKITQEEQEQLRTKTVGIAGLSVGRTVAITIALERIAGCLVLADQDSIELSNINRIKCGLDQLGTNKSISTAREIALFDPYLKVICFPEGLQEDNMDSFFTANSGLDAFIEECDDLPIKVHSRVNARKRQIPVLMEASDNCLVDIERFDLEPQRPLLHGIMDEEVVRTVDSLKTFEEKLGLMAKIVDINNISARMQSSLPEIGKSLRTWPQLASDVTYGGGIMAKFVRQLFLGEALNSGRYYFEVESGRTNNLSI